MTYQSYEAMSFLLRREEPPKTPPQVQYQHYRDLSPRQMMEISQCTVSVNPETSYSQTLADFQAQFAHCNPATTGFITAEAEGKIVGFVRVWQCPDVNRWLTEKVTVMLDYQNQGIGLRLVQEGIQFAKEMGASVLFSHISKRNIPSIRIHKKAGFILKTSNSRELNSSVNPESQYEFALVIA